MFPVSSLSDFSKRKFQPVSTFHSPHHGRWWTFLSDAPLTSWMHAPNRDHYLPPTLCTNYISSYSPHLNRVTVISSSLQFTFHSFTAIKYRFGFKHFSCLQPFSKVPIVTKVLMEDSESRKVGEKNVSGWEIARREARKQVKRGEKWWYLRMRWQHWRWIRLCGHKIALGGRINVTVDEVGVMLRQQVGLWGGHFPRWEKWKKVSRSRLQL